MAKEDDIVVVGVGLMTVAVGLSRGRDGRALRPVLRHRRGFAEAGWGLISMASRSRWPKSWTTASLNWRLTTGRRRKGKPVGKRRPAAPRASLPLLDAAETIGGSLKQRPGLILALPEVDGREPLQPAAFLNHLAQQTGDAFEVGRTEWIIKGRAGGLCAVARAAERIHSGQARFVLAAGVDTYRHLGLLTMLDKEKRVKSSHHLDGFIPGEGAGALLLASRSAARAAGLPGLAVVSPVTESVEDGHLYSEKPYRGDGLANTVTGLLRDSGLSDPIREVYSSMRRGRITGPASGASPSCATGRLSARPTGFITRRIVWETLERAVVQC